MEGISLLKQFSKDCKGDYYCKYEENNVRLQGTFKNFKET